MNGYALKADGSYRAVSDDMPLQPGEIFVVTLPDLSNSTLEQLMARLEQRRNNARTEARLATQLRTTTPQEAVNYIETNVTNLTTAKDVLKLMARMLIAMRDAVMPDLPE